MDENLINQTLEEDNDVEIQELDIPLEEIEQDAPTEEVTYEIVVEPEDETVIDISESMGWVSGDNRYHDSLLGIDFPNQHPIDSIGGLREKLDKIESLKIVYSDKPNIANYYKWKDAAYDQYGYFVSLVPGSSEIDICNGTDIFGVSVESAGFVGGQDAVVPRDNQYGLIVTSGLVGVRCELTVGVGDYVVSNAVGHARKSDSNYGYKVLELAKNDTTGETYAIIALGVQADEINKLGADLNNTKEQVNANYKNMISAVNVANQAYNKANEVEASNKTMSGKVDEAVGKIDGVVEDVGNLSAQVSNSAVVATQAKAIAESAVTYATTKANEALDETAQIRREFEASIDDVQKDIDDAVLYIDDTKGSLEDLTKDLEPLSQWESKDGKQFGYSGFVAQSDENTTELGWVSGYEYKDSSGNVVSTGLAGLVSQVEKNKSEIALIVSFEQEDTEGVAALVEKVSDHDAQLQTLTTWKDAQTEVVSNISQKTDKNSSDISVVSSWKSTVEDDVASISAIKTTADDNAASIEQLAQKDTELSTTIAGVKTTADANMASIEDITSWQGTTNTAMARIEQKADANGAYIQSTVANIDRYSVGPYSQAYGFTLEQAASVLEEGMIYVPTINKIGDDKEIYDYTDASDNTVEVSREFLKGYLYRWGKSPDGLYGWITVDKEYSEDKLNTSAPAVYFATTEPDVVGDFGYWYTNGDEVADGYEPYTLYKWDLPYKYKNEDGTKDVEEYHWVAVATLAGNSQNRAVSQIRQDSNSIQFDVTDVKGDLASIKLWAGEDFAAIQDVVEWHDDNAESIATTIQKASDSEAYIAQIASVKNEDGTINAAASIVTAVNEAGSSVAIDADHINLDTKMFTVRDKNNDNKILLSAGNGEVDIAGFTVTDKSIQNDKTSYNDSSAGVYLGTDGIGLGANKFSVNNEGYLRSVDGNIGGWSITEDSIEKNGTAIMAGNSLYDSLVVPDGRSPKRFVAGGAGSIVTKNQEIYMVSYGDTINKTLELPYDNYQIVDARANNMGDEFVSSFSKTERVKPGTGVYIKVCPSWVRASEMQDVQVELVDTNGLNVRITSWQCHDGGRVFVQVSDVLNILNLNVTVRVSGRYFHIDTPRIDVSYTDTTVTVSVTPTLEVDYSDGIGYHIWVTYESKYNGEAPFVVLEDGSLYSESAQIKGHIDATSGNIGGFTIKDGRLQSEDYAVIDGDIFDGAGSCSYSDGLQYTLINDSYYVVSGIGTCTDTNLFIPTVYNGKPVGAIANEAFAHDTSIRKVSIPNSVTYIGGSAFLGCSSLEYVSLGNGITSIYRSAFRACSSLASVVIPDSVESLGDEVFSGCTKLSDVVFGEFSRIKTIGNSSFCDCAFDKIELHDSIIRINDHAFQGCKNLKHIMIGTNMEYIDQTAFMGCAALTRIYYKGTRDEWVTNGLYDEYFYYANTPYFTADQHIYYYHENDDTAIGNYWHDAGTSGICISNDDTLISTKYFTLSSDGKVIAKKATIKGNLAADTVIAKQMAVVNSNQQTQYGITAIIPYMKSATEGGTLNFVNGILVGYT